jgi:hypothetical protein
VAYHPSARHWRSRRHNEIGNRMAEVIDKEAAAKLGKDWWKK